MDGFVGRHREVIKLNKIKRLNIASFVVVNGRRRIGKSRLICEFAKSGRFYKFTGIAPEEEIAAEDQRNEFMRQFGEQFNLPLSGINDWAVLFQLLANHTSEGEVIILLDEISWMAHGDKSFLGKLKTIWDDSFKRNPKLMLFLCGSVSAWIERNLLSSTAFLGRPTLHMQLKELPLPDCEKFWRNNNHISAYEKLKLLAITGGVPRYLELINPNLTAEDNIRDLFFQYVLLDHDI